MALVFIFLNCHITPFIFYGIFVHFLKLPPYDMAGLDLTPHSVGDVTRPRRRWS
jgi:hypothetical protein